MMATKANEPPSIETHAIRSSAPANSPKVSMFGTKSGFVIPKNKLSGSMVLRGGAKNETGITPKDESTKQIQRKTKWGLDLTVDPFVKKGRALAYQTRLEQINKQLKSGSLEAEVNEDKFSLESTDNTAGTKEPSELQEKNLKHLELERQEIIGEILLLNPAFKAPTDYRPLFKETRVPVPLKAYPGYSFLGLLLGPESNTQKRLEDETGAKICVYGTKKSTGEMQEITQADNSDHDAYADMYVSVSAETYEKVDAAVSLLELLLSPILASSTTASGVTSVSLALSSADVNTGHQQQQQPVLVTPQAALSPFQPSSAPWQPSAQLNTASPNNLSQMQPPFGSFSAPAFTGQQPGVGMMPLPVPGASGPVPLMHPPQPTVTHTAVPQQLPMPSVRLQLNVGPQPGPVASPGRPLSLHSGSGNAGWSLPPRPMASPLTPLRPPISVSPVNTFSGPPMPFANLPQQNAPTFGGQDFPFNTASAGTFPSRPFASMPSLPPVPPQFTSAPTVQALPPSGPAFHTSNPALSQIRPSAPAPSASFSAMQQFSHIAQAGHTNSTPVPEVSQATTPLALGSMVQARPSIFSPMRGPMPNQAPMQPPSISVQGFGSVPANAYGSTTPLNAPRLVRPVSGDFTFQPPGPSGPLPNPTRSHFESQAAGSFDGSSASFRPTLQNNMQQPPLGAHVFQRPPDVNPMGPPMPGIMSDPSIPYPQNPGPMHTAARISHFPPNSVRPFPSTFPAGLPNVPPAGPSPNLQGSMASHPSHFPRGGPGNLVNPSIPGGSMFHHSENFRVSTVAPPMPSRPPLVSGANQGYDPFLPTPVSTASRNPPGNSTVPRISDADPEYEDLMNSVGVK